MCSQRGKAKRGISLELREEDRERRIEVAGGGTCTTPMTSQLIQTPAQ